MRSRNSFAIVLAASAFLAGLGAPYQLDLLDGQVRFSSGTALAQAGGGNGNGGGAGGNGDGAGNGGGNGSGAGNGGGNGAGNGGGGGNGGGNGNGAGNGGNGNGGAGNNGGNGVGINASVNRGGRPAGPAPRSLDMVLRHPDGMIEKIENGRYEMQDASGRTIINRGATQADRARLGG